MRVCPDCRRLKLSEAKSEADADDPASLWCECPAIKWKPYVYDEDGEDGPD